MENYLKEQKTKEFKELTDEHVGEIEKINQLNH
jgi:hypothetical protein